MRDCLIEQRTIKNRSPDPALVSLVAPARTMQNLPACQKGNLRFLDRDLPAKWECNFKADRLRRLNKAKHRRISPSVF